MKNLRCADDIYSPLGCFFNSDSVSKPGIRVSTFAGALEVDFVTGFCATGGIIFSTVFLTVLATALAAVLGAGFAGTLATALGTGFVFVFVFGFGFTTLFGADFVFATTFGAGFAFATTFGAGFAFATTFGAGLALAFTLTVAARLPVVAFLPVAFAFALAVTNFNSPETRYRRFMELLRFGEHRKHKNA
ncbi:MAG: hypothetical protein LH481_16890 [Burkholderiales bacterium]|nr:hypothetical protein [Burkholderiales bacterium]